MRIEQLEHIIEISKTHSINLAAQNLHITQQSLSRSIKSLEDELSVLLLYRDHKGVSLTEQGQIVLKRAQEIIAVTELLHQDLQETHSHKASISGTLNIMYMNSFDLDKLMKCIQEFSKTYPDVKITIHSCTISSLLKHILNQKTDIGLISIPETFHLSQFLDETHLKEVQNIPLYDENLMVAVSKNSPLAKQKSISISTLIKQPFILLMNDNESDILDNWIHFLLKQYGTPNIVLTTSAQDIYYDAIANDTGAGMVYRTSIKRMSNSQKERMVMIPVRPAIKVFSSYVLNRNRAITSAMQAFLPYLKNNFQK